MLVVVGRIGRAHGLGGEVGIEVRTDAPETRFAKGAVLELVTGPRGSSQIGPPQPGWPTSLTVAATKWQSGRMLGRFAEVTDRTAAEALAGALLAAEVDVTAAAEDPDEFHDLALVGLAVRDRQGVHLGQVVAVSHLPSQDLLVVALGDGGPEVLVPFVATIVPIVDLAGGFLVVEAPDGLLVPDGPGDEPSR